jgi:signal transduction histidine kinase
MGSATSDRAPPDESGPAPATVPQRRLLPEQHDPAKVLLLLEGQSRVLEMIAEAAPLPAVLDELMRVLEEQAEGMHCSILLLSEDGKHLRHGAAPSLPERYNRAIDGLTIGPLAGSCGTCAFQRLQVIVGDIADDPLWVDYRELALDCGLRACWSTPVLSRRDDLLGTFAIYYREPRLPSPWHFDLIALATHLTRVAVERDELIAALRHSLQARDESLSVLAVASHELRSPLSALRLQTESLLADLRSGSPPAQAEQRAVRSLVQVDRLTRLVGDLLDVSSLSAGRLALDYQPGDLAELVRDTVERARESFQHQGCPLELTGERSLPGSWDRMRVDQVITNLLANALKYGRHRPVQVRVSGDAQSGRVQVQDQGIGIPAEQQQLIFQRFARAVSGQDYEGVGLGLWISRQIVEALGGSLRVESEAGSGSTFTVELPRAGGPRTPV